MMSVAKVRQGMTALPVLLLAALASPSSMAEETQVVASIATEPSDAALKGTIASDSNEDGNWVTARIDVPDEIAPPEMSVLARIDLSDQRMYVYVEGRLEHTWPVSTGRGSYRTPTGRWNAAWLSPRHRSRKYNNAPMPWSVFFYRGYAVHGTTEVKRLGRPASHGCVRLHPDNAKTFFQLVRSYGKETTLISIVR